MRNDSIWNLYLPPEYLPASVSVSLLSVMVLVVLFYYLNYYTKRRYFSIWTAAWLFYALWLVLTIALQNIASRPLLVMLKHWCLSATAVFLLWGSIRFLNLRARQVLMGLFMGFLAVWSYASAYIFESPIASQIPIFLLIGLASVLTGWSFSKFRSTRPFIGASLLSLGFCMWGTYLVGYPFLQLDEHLLSTGFFMSAGLQLFIAVSMIILVLEEVRSHKGFALRQIQSHKAEKESLRTKAASSEARYRELFDQASEGIVIAASGSLQILDLNRTAEILLGIKRTDQPLPIICGLCGPSDPKQGPPITSAEWLAWINQQRQINLKRPDGAAVPVEMHVAPVMYDGQKVYQIFIRELTERIRLEEQLRQAEKLGALGRVMGGIAHELNNPLAAIKGYLELILARHELSETTRADLEKVAKEGDRAANLVDNFLSFARAQFINRQPVDLNALVMGAVKRFESELDRLGIELRMDLAQQLPLVEADTGQMQQLLANLITNAFQALAEAQPPRQLRIASAQDGAGIRLLIQDNGPGVPDKFVQSIFEPFFTTKKSIKCAGLGLAVAHSIVSDHHGRICYEPAPGRGASFAVVLPVDTASASENGRMAAKADAGGRLGVAHTGRAKLLVVDDEPAIAELLGEFLAAAGHKPTICNSPLKAIELIQDTNFDAIISDMRMPELDGRELYQIVIQKKPALAQRFIFLSGDVANDEMLAFFRQTKTDYLTKPFRLAQVEQAVSETLLKSACD